MRCVKTAIAFLVLAPAVHHCMLAQEPSRTGERAGVAPRRPDVRFTLTPTQNIWTFLLLDSNNGRVWQVQYSMSDSSFAGRLSVNENALTPPASAHVGRFTLQETKNIFNFLLLDQDDGRVWQIQWSNDEANRGIVRVLSESVP
jgi:hypothetical protein